MRKAEDKILKKYERIEIPMEEVYRNMEEFLFPIGELRKLGAYLIKKTFDDELIASLDWSNEDIGIFEIMEIKGNYFYVERHGNVVEGKRISKEKAIKMARRC